MGTTKLKFHLAIVLLLSACLTNGQHPLFEHYSEAEGLLSKKVFGMAEGPYGTIWIATNKGIGSFKNGRFNSITKSDGVPHEIVFSVYPKGNDEIWFHAYPENLGYWNGKEVKQHEVNARLSEVIGGRLINHIMFDKQNQLWISTVLGGGLFLIDRDNKINEIQLDTSQTFSFFIKKLESGEIIWGSNSTGLGNNRVKIITPNSEYFIDLTASEGFSKSSCILTLGGDFIFAKDQEVIRCNERALINRTFVGKNVESLFEDSEGKIWVGLHKGGVICYPSGQLNTHDGISYLGSNTVSSVLEDSQNNIWIGTHEAGLYMLPGIPELVFTSPTIIHDKTDTTEKNVISVASQHTDTVQEYQGWNLDTNIVHSPTVYISGVNIMNRDTMIESYYTLRHNQNFLKISFIGFSGKDELTHYKYRMTGVNESWVYTNNPHVEYPLLPPGKYKFEVLAMNLNGEWSQEPESITFEIKPALWNTWWFRTGSIILIISLLWIFVKSRIKRLERKSLMDKKLIELEQKALRSQMNPHFIFNSLNSVQSFVAKKDTTNAEKYLSSFSRLMRQILNNSREQFITIENEISTLSLYLQLEKMRFGDKLNYEIICDPEIEQDLVGIPPMLVQPFVENAILHGIMNKTESGKVEVSFELTNGLILCTVKDDGVGRKKAAELKKESKLNHQSVGLKVSSERVELLNSLNKDDIKILTTDITDENNEVMGTQVELVIPFINTFDQKNEGSYN